MWHTAPEALLGLPWTANTHVQGVGGSNLCRLGCCMMWLGVWLGCRLQVHKVVISSQYQLNFHLCTHKHFAHPYMSLVRYVVGAAIPSSVANQRNQLQLGFGMRGVFARKSHSKGLLPHPYVAHCTSSIVGFAMDNQHTCTRCWRVKPMSIGMLHDVARGLARVSTSSSQGGNIQSISAQLLPLHSQTPCPPLHEPSSLCGRCGHTF
jgi:hypothetical protein